MPTQTKLPTSSTRIPVGISQCLLGEAVRYDGGHKHDYFITGTLAHFFDFVPVCPEMAIGMGVPREPIHLVARRSSPHAVGIRDTSLDVTDALHTYGEDQARKLTTLCGYIFKRGSPSCGMEHVKVYSKSGVPRQNGQGIYAKAFMDNQPLVPCEEEGRLGDQQLRENFIQRVFVLHRWRQVLTRRLTPGKLMDFHTRHKYIVMAHRPRTYQQLDRLIADAGKGAVHDVADQYMQGLMAALKRIATRKQHVHVLQHLLGYLKIHLDSADKQEMLDIIATYHRGEVPLIVPITLLKHHFRRYPDPYIDKQYYLTPHPQEMMVKSHE